METKEPWRVGSVGLASASGLAEVLAPRTVERFLGIRHHGFLMRVMGLREMASGVGILTGRRPSDWLWARVGGDVIDVASLGMALRSDMAKPVEYWTGLRGGRRNHGFRYALCPRT